MKLTRVKRRNRVRRRIRSIIQGTDSRPRLSVFRSNKEIYAQIINDNEGNTLAAASSIEKNIKKTVKKKDAEIVGELLAERALKKGIKEIKFDRGGYLYHGRVKALADSVRKKGLKF